MTREYVFMLCVVWQNFPDDEILIAYDADFKHGQNFVIATTVEAKEVFLRVSNHLTKTNKNSL